MVGQTDPMVDFYRASIDGHLKEISYLALDLGTLAEIRETYPELAGEIWSVILEERELIQSLRKAVEIERGEIGKIENLQRRGQSHIIGGDEPQPLEEHELFR